MKADGTPAKPGTSAVSRRNLIKGAVAAGGVAALTASNGLGFNIRTAKAAGTTWRVQCAWAAGLIGYKIFEKWANSIAERSGGELTIKPFPDQAVVGTFQSFDAARTGVLDGFNWFTLYGAGKLPATVFLSSYPLGPRTEGEWDTFYYGLGGLEIARDLYAKSGLYYVGPIQHGPNIIHSKVPIRSIDDFRGRKMRVPGGMVAELYTAAGAKTTLLPGSEIFPAMEKGTIDVADYVGPAINYEFGLYQVAKYISMGPPGFMSIYQPVDLMELTINMKRWNAISPKMRQFVEEEVHRYSDIHHAEIQKADQEAWPKFKEKGVTVTRLSEEDVEKFTKLAVPLWYKWANKDPVAARVFKIQLDYMMSPSLGYVTPQMIKGQSLKI
ncbi:MAG TPA: TRAP transporter substrate-binding protein DctP [bacterium]|nr:TRAP transporter substrate-binding protein DctP [bacterium]